MLCQKCKKRVAAYFVKKEINNEIHEIYLCRDCAHPTTFIGVGIPIGVDEFLSDIIGYTPVVEKYVKEENEDIICNNCKMNYNRFKTTGKLGCEVCYETFNDKLEPIIRRLHSNTTHTGKCPEEVRENIKINREINEMKEKLQSAVSREEYEEAAVLRDKIREMEAKK